MSEALVSSLTSQLSAHRLRRSSLKMLVILVVATTAPVAAVCFIYIMRQTPGAPFLYWRDALQNTMMIAGPVCLVALIASLMRNSNAKDVVSDTFGASYLTDDHPLTQRVHALAKEIDLPPPTVGIMPTANAFAVGATPEDAAVVLGTPLINRLSEDELDAVIGHELGHIASGDMNRMQMAIGFQQVLDWLFSAIGHLFGFILQIVAQANSRHSGSVAIGAALAKACTAIAQITISCGSALCIRKLSRTREFHADAIGALLTSPDAMKRALAKLRTLSNDGAGYDGEYRMLMFSSAGESHLWSTHPTFKARTDALESETYIWRIQRRMTVGSFHWLANLWNTFAIPLILLSLVFGVGAASFWLTLQLL